jgi:hypothetical protein
MVNHSEGHAKSGNDCVTATTDCGKDSATTIIEINMGPEEMRLSMPFI